MPLPCVPMQIRARLLMQHVTVPHFPRTRTLLSHLCLLRCPADCGRAFNTLRNTLLTISAEHLFVARDGPSYPKREYIVMASLSFEKVLLSVVPFRQAASKCTQTGAPLLFSLSFISHEDHLEGTYALLPSTTLSNHTQYCA